MRFISIVCGLWLSVGGVRAEGNEDGAGSDAAGNNAAQLERPAPDQGYYYTGGLHLAHVTTVDGGDADSGLLGYALSLRVGQSVTAFFDLGARIDYGMVDADGRSGEFGSFGLDATLRPHDAWLLRLGVGLGGGSLSPPPSSDDDSDVFGAIGAVEVGYSFFPFYESCESGALAVTPIARFTTFQLGSDDAAYWAMVGLELTYWAGLPKNQLDLTLDQAFPTKGK